MSGICGIVRFDGKPAENIKIQKMLDVMHNCGNDAEKIWVAGSIGFGHKMLWTTPESFHEKQPLVSDDGNLILTADARIDNREEIFELLDVGEKKNDVVTDANLILRSYLKWGEECPKYLIGDYAFAIWDTESNKLYCARDTMGIKQFYYYMNEACFISI